MSEQELVTCPDCGGAGFDMYGDFHDACPTCNGKKVVVPKPKVQRITQEQLDAVYEERNRLVAFLSHIFAESAWLSEGDDPEWPIVYMTLPATIQVSWHIPRKHLDLFKHLEWKPNAWDGHTTDAKYRMLELLGNGMTVRTTTTYVQSTQSAAVDAR